MRTILTICLTLIIQVSFSQVKFETNLKCKLIQENQSYFEYYEDVEKNNSTNNYSQIVKNDNRYVEDRENVILNFIVKYLENGKLIGLTNSKGDTLDENQIYKTLYWKWDISIHHEDTVRWLDIEDIKKIEIHQEWNVDTVKNSISNRILGISLLREKEGEEIKMLYIPFNNKFASSPINTSTVGYILQINNKYKWKLFPKKLIAKLLSKTDESFKLIEHSSDPININNPYTNNLDSLFQDIDLYDKNFTNTIINKSEGIHLSQLLYIDYDKLTINTKLNAIAPLFAMHDYEGNFKYYRSLYWLMNKVKTK